MFQTLKTRFVELISPSGLVIAALCTLVLAAAGPFGTYESQTFLLRLVYWTSVTTSSLVLGNLFHMTSEILIGEHRPIRVDLAVTCLMVVVFTPLLWALTHGILLYETSGGPGFFKLAYYVAVITIAICVFWRLVPRRSAVGYFGARVNPQVEDPRLSRRLSQTFQGPVLRLTVRDHFVDVVSAEGTETIRMRFGDAVNEMEPVEGYCTHRSHWVATAAIAGVERDGAKTMLKLTNGDLVPISRKYRPNLEKAGLL